MENSVRKSDTDDTYATDTGQLAGATTVLLTGDDAEVKRQEIREYFHHTFTFYERIFECLVNDKAFYSKATPLRHPLLMVYL